MVASRYAAVSAARAGRRHHDPEQDVEHYREQDGGQGEDREASIFQGFVLRLFRVQRDQLAQ
jgi:hypothetical protein